MVSFGWIPHFSILYGMPYPNTPVHEPEPRALSRETGVALIETSEIETKVVLLELAA